ncbi:MAG: hypothetical protein RLZZ301_1119 [Bacteroidota bacterium]|jgi:putative flippase GtrA
MAAIIRRILDFFYPLAQRFVNKTTYYYAACGGGNLVLSWFLFYVFFQFVFQKRIFETAFLGKSYFVSAYSLSSFVCFLIAFGIGFYLNKYIVFTHSQLMGRVQLLRYALSSGFSWLCNWLLLKLMIEGLAFFPSIANVISSCLIVVLSYFLQRKFTFR